MNTVLIITAASLCFFAAASASELTQEELMKKMTSGTVGVIGHLPHGPHGPSGPHGPPPAFCYCREGFIFRRIANWPYCQCHKIVRDTASWAEAKVYCQVMRANLMQVKDTSTHVWLQRQLYLRRNTDKHHLLEKAEYWLGSTDLENERIWRWEGDNSIVGLRYWLPAEPNNYLSYQNCLAIKQRSRRSYGWFDDDCYQRKFYICERRGWYCWGWSCAALYADCEKADIPLSVASAKLAPAPSTTPEKVLFEG